VDGNTFTTDIDVIYNGNYEYYIISYSDNYVSTSSNIVEISVNYIPSPYIISVSSEFITVTLVWAQDESYAKITQFNIFQNNTLVKTVDGNTFTTNIDVSNNEGYDYYIIAYSNYYYSNPSNTVSIYVDYVAQPPTNLIITSLSSSNGYATATLEWSPPASYDYTYPIYYNVFLNGVQIATNIANNVYIFSGLDFITAYTFGVQTSVTVDQITSSVVNISTTTIAPFNSVGSETPVYSSGVYTLFYNNTGSLTILSSLITSLNVILVGGGGGGSPGSTNISDVKGGGAGGGGESIKFTSSEFSINDQIDISIGSGGSGGVPGGSSASSGVNSSITLNSIYTAVGGSRAQGISGGVGGGSYGNGGATGNGNYSGGSGGQISSNNIISYGGGGGASGEEYNFEQRYFGGGAGGCAINGTNTIQVMTGGAGGGAGNTSQPSSTTGGNYYGGAGGLDVIDGDVVNQSGSSGNYGGGGGGGSGTRNSNKSAGSGGNGGRGYCSISFFYP
jgi:hypothetical protein